MLEIHMFQTMHGDTVIRIRGEWTAKDLRDKVKAFKALMGREPEILIMGGNFDSRCLEFDFWPSSRARVTKVSRKYMTVDHHGEVFEVYCPGESPYRDCKSNPNYYFDLR